MSRLGNICYMLAVGAAIFFFSQIFEIVPETTFSVLVFFIAGLMIALLDEVFTYIKIRWLPDKLTPPRNSLKNFKTDVLMPVNFLVFLIAFGALVSLMADTPFEDVVTLYWAGCFGGAAGKLIILGLLKLKR